ncbi:hypothetical protein [Nonomuraea basaltis]|uniref:hypothetical protein n=1 Tax=Nonomuraea basaltis TaxID=2495887 RepID=UPI00110C6436|nr:hypothetical protein [Nonomuraea basaltis]TMR97563.1 hypothetical protein EJK15_17755 [Nonomuraea basaltis]
MAGTTSKTTKTADKQAGIRSEILAAVLHWLTTKDDGTARPDKAWQALCEKSPTIAEAVSYWGHEQLSDRSRPGSGVMTASDAHPAEIVATYPDGRRIVTRADDGAWRLGVSPMSTLATRTLMLADFRKIAEADDPAAKAEEIATAAARRAKEDADKKAAANAKRVALLTETAEALGMTLAEYVASLTAEA